MSASPRNPESRELLNAEDRIIAALRFARTGTTAPQRRGYVKELARDFLSKGRVTPVRQILAVLHDAKERGASKAHLYAVADQLRSEIDRMYSEDEALTDFHQAHVLEERAEAEQDIAEAEFLANPSGHTWQRVAHATRQHIIAAEVQMRSAFQGMRMFS